MLNTSSLLALSPLDGRYQTTLTNLQPHLSEFALIKARATVEIQWLIILCEHPSINPAGLSADACQYLQELIANFNIEQAQSIKQIEQPPATTSRPSSIGFKKVRPAP